MTETLHRRRSRLTYQPALDGLRAVAVLAVLLYHHHRGSGFGRLGRGGFLGVDVFFVLSGFLITTILVDRRVAGGSIDLRRFWGRRFRRLMPALLLALLVAVVLGHSLSAVRQAALHHDLPYSLLYLENWHIAVWHGSQASTMPTWSLGVEEQFYLVWPMAVVGLLALTNWRVRRLLPIVAGLAIAGALWTTFVLGSGPRAYFGTDGRAQELLVGATLAIVGLGFGLTVPERRRRLFDRSASVLLSVLIVLLVVGPSAGRYDGLELFAFAMGVAVILLAAVQPQGPVRSVLATRPLVAIGRISYGLYLFHLPVFAWVNSSIGISGLPLFCVRLAVTGGLAWASYVFVERPIRDGRGSWRVLLPVAMGTAVAILALGATLSEPAPGPKSGLLAFALRTAASNTPDGADRVLVLGGNRAALLNLAGKGAFAAGTNWIVSLGTPNCGLTSPAPRCRAVPDDVAALARAYEASVVLLMPEEHDVADATSASGLATNRVVGRLDAIRSAVGARRLGVFTTPCGPGTARTSFDAVVTRWAERHHVAFAPSAAVDCRTGGETSLATMKRSIRNLATVSRVPR